MADLEATVVRCPECNAIVPVGEGAATATCEYCGTRARIQRRTRVLQRTIALPPPMSDEPIAVARQVFKRARFWLVSVVPGFAIPAAIVAIMYLRATSSAQWMGGAPLIVDVDGDGVDDAIGLIRYVHTDKITLAAYSGVNGHQLWETASLGTYDTVRHSLPELVGGVIVRRDGRTVSGYDVKTGAVRWHVRAADVVDRLCANAPGELAIRAATGEWSTVALETGAMRPASAPDTCRRAITTAPAEAPPGDVHVEGMSVQAVLARGTGPRIAIGWRTPGSGLTMLAAVDDAGGTRWKTLIATDDRWVTALAPRDLALDERDVALVYVHSTPLAPELVVFDRMTGARRFDVPLEKTTSTFDGIALTGTAVAVSQWGNLEVFDRATGREKFSIP